MRTILVLFLFGAGFPLVTAADQPSRTWTSNDGKTLVGSMVRSTPGGLVLRLSNGREVNVPLDRLSAADQAYAAQVKPGDEPGPEPGTELPKQADLRRQLQRWNLGPGKQGSRNTCSVFVTTNAFEIALATHLGKGVPLSVEYLNWACNQMIGNATTDRGQFFHDLLKGYEEHGLCRADLMPYLKSFENPKPTAEAVDDARELRKLGFEIHWIRPWSKEAGLTDAQFDAIKRVLAGGLPVCAGSSHSRLLVGYKDDKSDEGGGRFVTMDSGLGDFGEVTYGWVRANVYDLFWIAPPRPPVRR